ncbi:MAG: hypothetical protein KGL35_26920 [Bradyrhizobium sp.]|nr:hypothetical protein [Bradyrhizobium sp.]
MPRFIKRFENTGDDWSGLHAAESWLKSMGYSVGSMQRGAPIGIVKGPATIGKWRNLTAAEKKQLDGCIVPEGGLFRHSAAIVELYDYAPATAMQESEV